MSKFTVIWIGQLCAALGASISAFGLNLWIYKISGSVTQLSIGLFLTSLPPVALSAVFGAIVDRCDRRTILIVSDTLTALVTMALSVVAFGGHLNVAVVYIVTTLQACTATLRWPAYQALITEVVPNSRHRHVAGLIQLSDAAGPIVAPAIGGFMLANIGLTGLIWLDLAGSLVAIIASISVGSTPTQKKQTKKEGLYKEVLEAMLYIIKNSIPGYLLVYAAGANFGIGLVMILASPFALTFTSIKEFGVAMTLCTSGLMIGSVLAIYTGRIQRISIVIFTSSIAAAVSIGVAAMRPDLRWFTAWGFLFFVGMSVANTNCQLIWQKTIPRELQGRVFSARRMIAFCTLPVAYAAAGPIAAKAERLARTEWLTEMFSRFPFPTGASRGIALIFCVVSFYMLVLTTICFLRPPLWKYTSCRVEGEVC
ncbi:MFS transporter [Burkholderia ubonensis]|uniref:MFS transporter n=1 Tax=Burkholderia ubonensis TaxID=101571 RepID=UPI0009B2F4B3|nr:MFS transporter [Burkholderia ubonensis]